MRGGMVVFSLPMLIGSVVQPLQPLRPLQQLQPPPRWFAPEMLPPAQVAEAMHEVLAAPNTVIVIDGNNVRGRVGFRLGKSDLASLVSTWAAHHQLSEQVVIAWDHGQRSEALLWRGVCHGAAATRIEPRTIHPAALLTPCSPGALAPVAQPLRDPGDLLTMCASLEPGQPSHSRRSRRPYLART